MRVREVVIIEGEMVLRPDAEGVRSVQVDGVELEEFLVGRFGGQALEPESAAAAVYVGRVRVTVEQLD